MFTGTRFECNLTELELQWGRTIGQMPSPYTAGNPLVVPYHFDQGPLTCASTRRIKIQLAIFARSSLIAAGIVMASPTCRCRTVFFGVDRYTVTVQLPRGGRAVSRGPTSPTAVSRSAGCKDVRLTDTGVEAVLPLHSDIHIPADLDAQVHSVSAVGEQYVELLPRSGNVAAAEKRRRDPADRTYVPPDINSLLEATNRGLTAIPRDNLKTVVDESYTAVGGLGPELSRLVKGSTDLAIDARKNLDALIDLDRPVEAAARQPDRLIGCDSGVGRPPGHHHLSSCSNNDSAVAGRAAQGRAAADEARSCSTGCSRRCRSCWPTWSASARWRSPTETISNTFWCSCRRARADAKRIGVANQNTKQAYNGAYLSFNLNLNLPPPCTTGFLPAQQQRAPSHEDYPDRPRRPVLPDAARLAAQRARRAQLAVRDPSRQTRSDREDVRKRRNYVPLNDGFNWKGDPNATYTGQGVPQFTAQARPGRPHRRRPVPHRRR